MRLILNVQKVIKDYFYELFQLLILQNIHKKLLIYHVAAATCRKNIYFLQKEVNVWILYRQELLFSFSPAYF